MLRSAAIAIVATFVGGAASPVGSYFVQSPRIVRPAAVTAHPAAPMRGPAKRGLLLTRSDDGLFHAPVLINGHGVSLIVDTGATVTVLTARDADRLGVARTGASGDTLLQTAGGASAMRWARVRTLRVAGRDLTDLDVAIVEHGLVHSLLGQDVLAAAGVLRVEGESMEIS